MVKNYKKNYKKNYRNYQELVPETYLDYQVLKQSKIKKEEYWLIDILNGINEQDNIIYSDDKFVLMKKKTWNETDLSKIELVAFVRDINLKSLRDLTDSHIMLLEHINEISFKVIENKYGIKKSKIKSYLHYHPTVWILHIHFNLITNTDVCSSLEYSYLIFDIIENLKFRGDYYQKMIMYVLCNKKL